LTANTSVPEETLSFSSRWRAAIYLGLISSTFSTIVSQLSAARIGRDAAVDWMSVAAIPARDWALSSEPSAAAIAIGIAFHQWGGFFLGSVLLRCTGPVDGAASSGDARIHRGSLGHFHLGVRMVGPGPPVSVLAADLHVAAALLDRLSRPSFLRVDVSTIRMASSNSGTEAVLQGTGISSGVDRRGGRRCRHPGGFWRCSPRAIENCLGSVAIRTPTRHSSGTCLRTINRGSNLHRLPLKKQ